MASEVWRWQGGTTDKDNIRGASAGPNDSYTLAGHTEGNWSGVHVDRFDWAAVNLDADGTIQWAWQRGAAGLQNLHAVATADDGSTVMVGNAGETTQDFAAVKLNEGGTFQWEWQDGSSAGDEAFAVVMTGDGSAIFAGRTYGSWGQTHEGSSDFTATKLDSNMTLIWVWQNGTGEAEEMHAAAIGDDEAIVLAGHTYGNWTEAQGGDEDADFAAVKLDADGTELWRWQNGSMGNDMFYGAAMGEDGSVVLAGSTEGSWDGERAGDVSDFAAVKLNADGEEVWRWQDGTTEEDVIQGVAPGDDGSVVLAGYTKGAWSGTSDGSYDYAAVKLDASGVVVWRWQDGSDEAASDQAMAVAAGPNGVVLLAGDSGGSWAKENAGSSDFAALMLDTDVTVTPSPISGLLGAAGALSPTLTPTGPSGEESMSPMLPHTGAPAPPTPTPEPLSLAPSIAAPRSLAPLDSTRTNTPAGDFTPAPLNSVSTSSAPALPAPTPTGLNTAPESTNMPSSQEGTRSPGTALSPPESPASLAPASSPAPTRAGLDHKATSRPVLPSELSAPASASTSTPGISFSPLIIGIVSSAVAVVVIVAGLYLRRKLKSKQIDDDDKQDGGAFAIIVEKPDETRATANDTPSPSDPPPSGQCSVVQAVLEAANHLAQNSQFPGVSEAAMLVSTLVDMISNDQGRMAETEARLARCGLLVTMLEQAAIVLGNADTIEDTDSIGGMKRVLIKNVQDAIGDMVGLIKTYKSKRRIAQVLISTLFKRRMEEAEAVINQAFSDLMRWLQIDTALHRGECRDDLIKDGRKANAVRRILKSTKEKGTVGPRLPRQATEIKAEFIVSARQLRRQRNLDQIEIPEHHVLISEEILGKGGFGTVYLADYNGRNAAAKVIKIDHDQCALSGPDDDHAMAERTRGKTEAARQRTSVILELQAMLRLRSAHTVNVYGAMTSRKDELILVMELLTGGDLRSLLKHSTERIPEAQARGIVQDVCAGMAFLHSKHAVHGDLKSANVLLDGDGRAKIGDFGTSRWGQTSDSTGLATYRATQGNAMHMMSFAWAAPEVLSGEGSSYASDVYSFGIVAWEVFSMKAPWADEALPIDIYRRVVFKGDRPVIPAEAPGDIADLLRACWAAPPQERPTSNDILEILKAHALGPWSPVSR